MMWRIVGAVIALLLAYAFFQFAWHVSFGPPRPKGAVTVAASSVLQPGPVIPAGPGQAPAIDAAAPLLPPLHIALAPCRPAPKYAGAATVNASGLQSVQWSVFGRPEMGWEIYAPQTAVEIGTACPPVADGFAQALAVWQSGHALPPTGVMDVPTLTALRVVWLRRRPFNSAMALGCPPAPAPERLASATPQEGYSGKPIQLRTGALAAYRAMLAAARAEEPAVAADTRLLTIFSGYRDPATDAANCAREGNCGTIAKANCSAHRTGLAIDVYLGSAEGFAPESSADANRLYQSRSPAFRWLSANAARFGFVSYPFEPWHWEWTGETV